MAPFDLGLKVLNLAIPNLVLQFIFLVWYVTCSLRNLKLHVLDILQSAFKLALCISRMNILSPTCLLLATVIRHTVFLDINMYRNSRIEEKLSWIRHEYFVLVLNSPRNQCVTYNIRNGGDLGTSSQHLIQLFSHHCDGLFFGNKRQK